MAREKGIERGNSASGAPKWRNNVLAGKVRERLKAGDTLERYEGYAAFVSDGQKVAISLVRYMVDCGMLVDAKPNVGAAYRLPGELPPSAPHTGLLLDSLKLQLQRALEADRPAALAILGAELTLDDLDELKGMFP